MPPLLMLTAVLLVIGAIASTAAIWVMARALIRPPRMTDGKAAWLLKRLSPGDLGLTFADTRFIVRDVKTGQPLTLAGWWIPHPNAGGKCVVLVHGYADAKVGAIAWAPTWHSLGFNIMAIDLRAHGESEGRFCTGGDFERHDLADVVDQLRAERAAETRQVVLFGISLGAAAAIGAAALREHVADAVVLESPFADFRSAAMAHMDLLGLPGRTFQKLALSLAQRLTGADFPRARPVDLIRQATPPVMVIAPADDVFLNADESRRFEGAISARGNPADVFWRIEGAGHLRGMQADAQTYHERIRDFVVRALKRGPTHPVL